MSFLNVICLLNVLYILVKYHENINMFLSYGLHKMLTILKTKGDNSWTKSDLSFLYLTPLPNALYNLSFRKIAQMVVRSCGVHNNAFMDSQMDGWTDGFHADSYIP